MQTRHSIQDYIQVVQDGLHQHYKAGGFKKRVIVVGAGLAGLSAAHELLRAGHEPLILEAQHRVGGRIYTMREPFSRGLYGEAGAMRIPRSHKLTMAYIEKFGLQTSDFPMENPQTYVYIGGVKRRIRICAARGDCDSPIPLIIKTLRVFEILRVYSFEAPAGAVCCGVLNLLSQVGPYPETPPWLRPIALFLEELETLKVGVGSKRKVQHHEHCRDDDSYTIKDRAMVEKN